MTETPSISLAAVAFSWPDGTPVFEGLTASFGSRRTGLIGRNGTGKTTLMRLIAGELNPASGSITTTGTVGYLPQARRHDEDTIATALGIADVVAARAAIENGSTAQGHFDTLDGRWDQPERASAFLAKAGLSHIATDFHRTARSLSGGEWALTCLTGVILAEPGVLLLDEPTNDLDAEAREQLQSIVDQWNGPLVVISHDRALLERVDEIAELRRGTLTTYGGGFSDYLVAKDAEQQAADRAVRAAAKQLDHEKQQKIDAQVALTRRQRYANTDHANKRRPKVVMNERKRQAQVSAGKYRLLHAGKVDEAQEQLADAQFRAQRDDHVRIDLPDTTVPAGKTVLELHQGTACLTAAGPARIALVGSNGSGKTTLLDRIAGRLRPHAVDDIHVTGPTVPFAYLDQHLSGLDPDATPVEQVRRSTPARSDNEVRAQLARLLIRGRQGDQYVRNLSGGERYRVALAAALLATPAPQLLLLDEPTNNLDLASAGELAQTLNACRGALTVASHDPLFLDDIQVSRTWLSQTPFVLATEES